MTLSCAGSTKHHPPLGKVFSPCASARTTSKCGTSLDAQKRIQNFSNAKLWGKEVLRKELLGFVERLSCHNTRQWIPGTAVKPSHRKQALTDFRRTALQLVKIGTPHWYFKKSQLVDISSRGSFNPRHTFEWQMVRWFFVPTSLHFEINAVMYGTYTARYPVHSWTKKRDTLSCRLYPNGYIRDATHH